MHLRISAVLTLFLLLLSSVPAFAGCEEDFAKGVDADDRAREAMNNDRWSDAARLFDEAADLFDRAAGSCFGDNAQTSRDNAATLRRNAALARDNARIVNDGQDRDKAYADSDVAERKFQRAVDLTEKDDYAAALPLFRDAERLWKSAIPGLDAEDKGKARRNAQTAAQNAKVCERKAGSKADKQSGEDELTEAQMNALIKLALVEVAYDAAKESEDAGDLEKARKGYADVAQVYREMLPELDDPEIKSLAQEGLAKAEAGLQRVKGDASDADGELAAQAFVYAIAETVFDEGKEAYDKEDWKTALDRFTSFREAFAKIRPKLTNEEILQRGMAYDEEAKKLSAECRKRLL